MVNFKSPPRAVFKSSHAARQACALTRVHARRSVLYNCRNPRLLSQAVVTCHITCLALSDKAAAAHVEAMSAALSPGRFQGYEPTGVAA